MVAVLVALNTVKLVDLACELPFLVPFSQPFANGLFFAGLSAVHTGNAGGGGQPLSA